jgi:membrane-bound lytic murein transglycosylase D
VSRFIAAVLIVGDPGRFGFALPKPYPALKFETIAINRAVRLDGLAAALGIEPGELVFLNPELRSKSTPDREYALRVPIGAGDRTRAAITVLPLYLPPVETTVSVHVVRLGETLTAIASKYRTTVAVLQKLNNLKGTTISTGQRLRVPGRG